VEDLVVSLLGNASDTIRSIKFGGYDAYSPQTKDLIIIIRGFLDIFLMAFFIGAITLCLFHLPTTLWWRCDQPTAWTKILNLVLLISLIIALPVYALIWNRNWEYGLAALTLGATTGLFIVSVTRGWPRSRRRHRYVYTVTILSFSLTGGLTGNVTGGNQTEVVGQLVPVLFTVAVGAAAYLYGVSPTGEFWQTPSSAASRVKLNPELLSSSTLSFILAFFLLYQVADRRENKQEGFELCRSIYTNPSFLIVNSEQADARDEFWKDFCRSVFNRRFGENTVIPDGWEDRTAR
jgi:hypothetical protein